MISFSFGRVLTRAWQATGIALAVLTLSACGGSGGAGKSGDTSGAGARPPSSLSCEPANSATASECGVLLVGITDAEGDIVSYSVDVLSLTLERADGSIVETLPSTTRIDFAQLTDVSELLSVQRVVPGEFIGGSIRLDFSDAEILVEVDGEIVAAQVVDESRNPLGITDFTIQLPENDHLMLRRGHKSFLSVDFDLAATHELDASTVPPQLVAEPLVVAEVVPITEKELRVRGTLVGVDTENGSYDIRVRPWHRHDGDHGVFTVQTTADTSFEIGDQMYTGGAGLEALAALEPGILTVAFGTFDFDDYSLTAAIVHAGASVEGDSLDAVRGNIVARSGNLLKVKGAFASRRSHRARPYRTVTIDVGPETRVYKDAVIDSTLSEQDLSVGQQIVAFGDFIESDPESTDSEPLLDATHGNVRMNATRLHGTVTSIVPGQINMQLRAIDRLGIEIFDFAGTGMTDTSNADPTDYEILTGTLSLSDLSVGRAAEVLGFVTPFGFAPPDFAGHTVIGNLSIPSKLGISWTPPGTTAPFTSMGLDGLVIDLGNPEIGERHHIWIGRELVDLTMLASAPTITPSEGRTLFSLWESGHVELFNHFAAFLDELTLRLNDGAGVRALYASGNFDELANSVEARHIVILTETTSSSAQ